MSKRVGVVLSGCGFRDGSEINEAVLTLLHLEKAGVKIEIFAPDIDQTDVVNHKTGETDSNELRRNTLDESARIARGNVQGLFNADASKLDALIVPGGFGAAMNLSDFAFRDVVDDMDVELHLKALIEDMYAAKKPMGFICIAPASVAAVALRNKGIQLTCGNDDDISAKIGLLGNIHVQADVDEIVIDDEHNIVSTPAYMLARKIIEAEQGISKLVEEVVRRANAYEAPAEKEEGAA